MINTLPNILTLLRIAIIPFIAIMMALPGFVAAWAALLLYAAACITDYFDGYFARTMQESSQFGKLIDPIADKLLITTVLFMLISFDKVVGVSIIAALVILLREIIVSGLREFLATLQVGLPVSNLAKWKTTVQMIALGFLITGDYAPWEIPGHAIGIIGIWLAAILTLVTGYDYFKTAMRTILSENKRKK